MMKRIFVAAMLMIACSISLHAQTKAEQKLYNKTIAKPSLAAYDKFLKKYPSSVLAEDISARKDTLLNITPYSEDEAAAIIGGFLPEGTDFKAIADRREAVDRIYGICISGENLPLDRVRIVTIVDKDGKWENEGSYEAPSADAEGMAERKFVDAVSVMKIRGTRYLLFNYLCSSADSKEQTYVAAYYAPQTDEFGSAAFSGTNTLKTGSSEAYHIYGRSNEALLSGLEKPQMRILLKELNDNSSLEVIPESILLTDEAIKFWIEKNPDALTSARHLTFNTIQKETLLVEKYAKSRKQNSSKYSVAMFDLRGYTVIVVYQKASDDYVLAWVEPVCKNKKTDRLLNSVSFTDANTLEMFYYKGNSFFKYRLNLASKNLTR